MESSSKSKNEEENNICPMTYHEENEVNNITFEFIYNELFCVCKNVKYRVK